MPREGERHEIPRNIGNHRGSPGCFASNLVPENLGAGNPPPHTTSILGPSLLLLALLVPSLQGKQFFVDTGTALYYAGGGTLLFN